jgi:hypothetical protein
MSNLDDVEALDMALKLSGDDQHVVIIPQVRIG